MAVVSRYERLSAQGSMEPRSEDPPFFVAVKRIRAQFQGLDHYVKLFELECENVSFVSSVNLVHVYGVEMIDGFKSIVMEWVEGCTLDDLLEVLANRRLARSQFSGEPWLSPKVITYILRSLLHGIKDIHTYKDKDGQLQCLIHRDVSPRNVLLGIAGEVKLADFGLSKRGRSSQFVTNGRPGTLAYMAPERLRPGEKKYERSVDLYAVGAILFELISQQCYAEWSPALGLSIKEKHALVREYLMERGANFAELAELAFQLLQPNPQQRMDSAALALDRIKALPIDAQGPHELGELVRTATQDVRRRRRLDQVDRADTNVHDSVHAPALGSMGSRRSDQSLGRLGDTVDRVAATQSKTLSTRPGSRRPGVRFVLTGGAVFLAAFGVSPWVDACDSSKEDLEAGSPVAQSAAVWNRGAGSGVAVSTKGLSTGPESKSEPMADELLAFARQDARARIDSTLGLFAQASNEEDKEVRVDDLGRALGSYLELTQATGLSVDWTAPEHKAVTEALAVLEPWYRKKTDARFQTLLESLREQYPNRVPGSSALENAKGSGILFSTPVPEYFTPQVWSQSVRLLACAQRLELRSAGWLVALDAEQRGALDLRSRYFAAYDQAWRGWFESMRWKGPFTKRQATRALSVMSRAEASPLAALKSIVVRNGEVRDWSCDDETRGEPLLLPLAADLTTVLEDDDLEQGYAKYASALAKAMSDGALSPAQRKRRDRRIAQLERATARSFEGSRAQVYAQLRRATTRPLGWARTRLQASKPSGAATSPSSRPHAELARRWCERIQAPFERAFDGRYPFKRTGRNTASLKEVRDYFHPKEGSLWRELASMSNYVERKGNRFVLRNRADTPEAGLSRQALFFLNKAWVFAQSMFPAGQAQAQLRFELSLQAGQHVRGAQITVGDTLFLPGYTGRARKRLTWPDQTGFNASVTAQSTLPESRGESLFIRANKREWSLFWLLEQGTVLSDGFGVAQLGWSRSEIPNSAVHAQLRLIGSSSLFFGPSWAHSSFLRVLRIRAPKKPLAGDQGC